MRSSIRPQLRDSPHLLLAAGVGAVAPLRHLLMAAARAMRPQLLVLALQEKSHGQKKPRNTHARCHTCGGLGFVVV